MFLDTSRYAGVPQDQVTLADGRTVSAVCVRRLPAEPGKPTVVAGNDRLDAIAQRTFGDPTKFWHVADANTELQASRLVATPGRVIQVPEP